MEELMRLSQVRDEAEKEFLRCLWADAKIAEFMRDYWKHQQSGAE